MQCWCRSRELIFLSSLELFHLTWLSSCLYINTYTTYTHIHSYILYIALQLSFACVYIFAYMWIHVHVCVCMCLCDLTCTCYLKWSRKWLQSITTRCNIISDYFNNWLTTILNNKWKNHFNNHTIIVTCPSIP